MDRIVLAYSGGLDPSIAIAWLAETFKAEVVTVTLDVGHGSELVEIRQRALALGAVRAHVIDVRDEFIRDYALPALQAGALYGDRAPMTTALTRPLIARKLVDVARMEGATAVAHGCAATSDDGIRLDTLIAALDPALRVIVPTRMWDMTREEATMFANEHSIPPPASSDAPYKTDANVWGRSTICSPAQDPWTEPSEEIYALDEICAGLSGAAGVCRDRIRVRTTASREQHRDAAARDDRKRRNDRWSPRRRAHRPHRDPADRRAGARDLRSSGRGRASCRAQGTAAARHAIGSRAGLPRSRPDVCGSDKWRPVVLANAHGD